MKPAISVITPTIRPDGLVMLWQCLQRQTCQDFEWLISAPEGAIKAFPAKPNIKLFRDPPKREGDFYSLNKAWNNLVKNSQADLLVFAVDWIWFENTALEQLLAHYLDNPMRCVSVPGDHFRKIDDKGKPYVLWEYDRRLRDLERNANIWELPSFQMELSFSALPRNKLVEVGGFDEAYDAHFGMSEKELAVRMQFAGCSFIIDRTQSHRIYTHEREWQPKEQEWRYAVAVEKFNRDARDIVAGKRRVIPWAGLEE